ADRRGDGRLRRLAAGQVGAPGRGGEVRPAVPLPVALARHVGEGRQDALELPEAGRGGRAGGGAEGRRGEGGAGRVAGAGAGEAAQGGGPGLVRGPGRGLRRRQAGRRARPDPGEEVEGGGVMTAVLKRKLTPAEYLAVERKAE